MRVAVTQRIQQDGQWRDGDTSFLKVNVWRGQAGGGAPPRRREGPSHGARGATQVTARSWTRGNLTRASLTTPSRIVNQTRRPLDTPASLGNQPGAQHVGGSGNEALED